MGKLKSNILLLAAMVAAMYSCKKGEVVSDPEANGSGSYVTLVSSQGNTINYANLAGSKVGITVKEYGEPIEKIVLYVTKGASANLNRTAWKKIKEVPYSGETKLEVTAAEIATALGVTPADLSPGTSYIIYNQCVTKAGAIHDAANTNSGYQGLPAYNMVLTWSTSVICPFAPPAAGTYIVVADQWADWSVGDEVQVTDGPGANQVNLSKVWPNPIYGTVINPLYITVNPATGAATSPSGLAWGDYSAFGFTTVNGTGSTGFVFSCIGTIDVSIRFSAPPFGDQGLQKLTLRKK
ncbi:MAG: hypothetical protein SFU87_07645 [Chitinophagaceae bacterium]|nr:hypothetical protein [Chitinophagaceae bacterium]